MPSSVTLNDGSRILIRPIGPDDRDALSSGFSRLGDESRHLRFFGPMPRLSESQLSYLTDVDHHDHEALVAIDQESGDGIAVARFVRLEDGVAEPAVAVVDEWQRRGVGSLLLDELADRAREEGVSSFVAPVLAENAAAISLIRRLGATEVSGHGPQVELRIELDQERGAAPALHGLLRHAAAETILPAVSFWHRLMVRPAGREPAADLRIVVAVTDGARTLEIGAELAGALGATLHVVSVLMPLSGDEAEDAMRALKELCAGLRSDGVDAHGHLIRGDLAAAILEVAVAELAGLIVVDGGQPAGALRAGAWDHVAHHAPCNVLVAR